MPSIFTVPVRLLQGSVYTRSMPARACQRSAVAATHLPSLSLSLSCRLPRARERRRNSRSRTSRPLVSRLREEKKKKKEPKRFQANKRSSSLLPKTHEGPPCICPQPPQQGNLLLINCALLNGFRIFYKKNTKCAWDRPHRPLMLIHPRHPNPPNPSARLVN